MRAVSFIFVPILALALTGCYNNPGKSRRHPGQGPERFTGGPAVGPGTVAGGSTAGPQPKVAETGGHVMPTAAGAHQAKPGLDHAEAPHPVVDPNADAPKGPPSRTGSEKGGDNRGTQEHSQDHGSDEARKKSGAHD